MGENHLGPDQRVSPIRPGAQSDTSVEKVVEERAGRHSTSIFGEVEAFIRRGFKPRRGHVPYPDGSNTPISKHKR